jgi:hypothetical protein
MTTPDSDRALEKVEALWRSRVEAKDEEIKMLRSMLERWIEECDCKSLEEEPVELHEHTRRLLEGKDE